MQTREIKKNIFWVGAIDWNIRDFHGYSTPQGTTYNSYLIKDKKTALFDTVKRGFSSEMLDRIRSIVSPEDIDYIIVNHVEMDHSSGLLDLVDIIKPEKIYCSANGKKALLAHYHREDWPYEIVKTGDEISLGEKTVKFIETKMLHWPDSMFSYIKEDELLFSQDAFGQHWATTERFDDEIDINTLIYAAETYYANILLLYSSFVQRLLADIKTLDIKISMIAPDHGLIWRGNIDKIICAYDRWSKQIANDNKAIVVYDTMWHSTQQMANAIADGLVEKGVCVKVMNLQVSNRSDVITELHDAKAIVLGSATLNNGMLPRVGDLITYMRGLRPQGKVGASFGSFGWGGEAVKLIATALEEMKVKLVDPGLKINYVPTHEDLQKCRELGYKIADEMKSIS